MNAMFMDPFRFVAVPLRNRERERVEDDPLAHARGYGSGTRPNATPPVLHLLTLVATRVESDPRNGSCSTRSRSRLHGFQRGRSG